MNRSIRASPQVHISVNGEGENVGQGSSWAAAADEHSHSFNGSHVQQPGEAERCEGHDAKLCQQCDEHALRLQEVAFDFGNLHGASQGNHGDEEDDDGEDVDCFVEGLRDAQCGKSLVSAGICCCFPVDLCHVHVATLSQTVRGWKRLTLDLLTANGRSAIQEIVPDCCS